MDVRLDDATMKDIIAKSIVDTLTPETRQAMIQEAVKNLLKQETGNSYDKRSQLQKAFDWAVEQQAKAIAQEELGGDAEIKGKIRKMFIDAWEKMTADGDGSYEKMVDKIADSMRKAITGERY